MRLHLYTTDPSGLALIDRLPGGDQFVAVVVPENRAGSEKVEAVHADSPIPIIVHGSGGLASTDVPPADAIVSWMYSQIISTELLGVYAHGGINMHGGCIPDYRGANVLNWAIANGEASLCVTWHEIVEKVDAGGILAEATIPIGGDDTALMVRGELIKEGIRIFPDAFQKFQSASPPIRIPELTEGHVWPSRRPSDGRIEFEWPEEKVSAMIRAQTGPWPDATVLDQGEWHEVCGITDKPGPGRIAYGTADGGNIYLILSSHGS
jgi:methionyl-tRNA formyltransferase